MCDYTVELAVESWADSIYLASRDSRFKLDNSDSMNRIDSIQFLNQIFDLFDSNSQKSRNLAC